MSTTIDMDDILNGVLDEIKLSKKKPVSNRVKTTMTKKNKSAIKKASQVQIKSVSPEPPSQLQKLPSIPKKNRR